LSIVAVPTLFAITANDRTVAVRSSATAAPRLSPHAATLLLKASRADANKIVSGSIKAKLAALKGVPVIVNAWASWCGPCKEEFPFFQHLARDYGNRVAFIGLNSEDSRGSAQAFLRDFPVPYPSIADPNADEMHAIGGGGAWPTTFFYDRAGRQTYIRFGNYTAQVSLEADLKRFALGHAT
jgi:thiol-disulfide isomerase/thioredoxin